MGGKKDMNLQKAQEKLKEFGQEHVLKYYDELSDDRKKSLVAQVLDTDLSVTAKVTNGITTHTIQL